MRHALRDHKDGRYGRADLAERFGVEAVDGALRVLHEQVFATWLNFTLEQQTADLRLHLSSIEPDGRFPWRRLTSYRELLPDSASEVERQLFLCDLRFVIALAESEPETVRESLVTGLAWHGESTTGSLSDHRVLRMMEDVKKEHGNVRLTIQGFSLRLRTCERHLGRLFKKCTGMAFRNYSRSVRMLEAKTRLLKTPLSVQQIALALGYEVPANFTRDFKHCFDVCPVEFRHTRNHRI